MGLEGAIERRDGVVIQKKIIKIIEIITVWMEIIEYRIRNIKNVHTSERDQTQEYQLLFTEILMIEERIIILEKSTVTVEEILTSNTNSIIKDVINDLKEQIAQLKRV